MAASRPLIDVKKPVHHVTRFSWLLELFRKKKNWETGYKEPFFVLLNWIPRSFKLQHTGLDRHGNKGAWFSRDVRKWAEAHRPVVSSEAEDGNYVDNSFKTTWKLQNLSNSHSLMYLNDSFVKEELNRVEGLYSYSPVIRSVKSNKTPTLEKNWKTEFPCIEISKL